ncbi:MAG TPA: GNAT family N-acetyltransferase [Burkholderiaceae bacterium]
MEHIALNIHHEARPDGGRFWAEVEGRGIELDYELQGRRALFVHTGTDPALGGRGFAAQIVQAGWDWAQAQGLEVVPVCSYVAVWMQRNKRAN